ncbi:sugar kinase [Rudanella paleaurantiibacter]|uniref:Sugar kinase n=1 Tax=Rudanella paleaurantiibacter TaxID=2614655 RepID=A0A7J5TZP9_9BACT|nr:sugar kinase [Rudanella paleaurantiibacter]KAB7730963.1 sugar kinase [Rudanella paleaurantiibacter]
MSKVCCFGELLLRFSPHANGEWIRQATMPVFVGGAELNVATALANWHVPVRYNTVLPHNALADDMLNQIQTLGIDTAGMTRFGSRVGSYYLPQGSDLKNAGVIYDRAYSAFSELAPGKVDWEAVLDGISWLHVSAISPALSQAVADACLELLTVASTKGITVSMDLNYRAKLWQYGKRPSQIMPALVEHCDLVMGNIWAAHTLLDMPLDPNITDDWTAEQYVAHAAQTADAIRERFGRCRIVANTFRFDNPPGGIRYYATLHTNGQTYVAPEFLLNSVVDKVGSGDCFMAGLIYGHYNRHEPQAIIDFAAAAAVGKLQEFGDASAQTEADVRQRLQHSRSAAPTS